MITREQQEFLKKCEARRSPWLQGVLDREAGQAIEPRDFDTNQHWYAKDYIIGVREYDLFKGSHKNDLR